MRTRLAASWILWALASAAFAAPVGKWQVVGKTYNSVMFLDLGSIRESGGTKLLRVMRVSGQPSSDGWNTVTQQLRIGCAAKTLDDLGSTITKRDGSKSLSPPALTSGVVPERGVYADLFQLCVKDGPASSLTIRRPGRGRHSIPGLDKVRCPQSSRMLCLYPA
jgi:hypothetical protein